MIQKGQRDTRRVAPTSKLWKSFLRENNNTELFHFLADRLSEEDMPCLVTVTKAKEDVCCHRVIALEDLAYCTHEEADSQTLTLTLTLILCTHDMRQ